MNILFSIWLATSLFCHIYIAIVAWQTYHEFSFFTISALTCYIPIFHFLLLIGIFTKNNEVEKEIKQYVL